ncbi:hypothetical protein L5515_014311 [Caenorhabditis briggsae]|uniref:EGF-like domain-containing protein n=1 Tax=Caenorhabditis briggsae TaxID=6238 RepID=A0AAE9EFP4_CAEBR|nr:hypothetical protein L5515_014311 [Caenorhabditis briggsae]
MIRSHRCLVNFFVLLLAASSVVCAQLANCQNYGTPLNSTDCKCPAYVAGRNCENVICRRYAVPDKDRCACAPGWYDKYCGLRGCRPPNEDQMDLEKRSLIVVFNTKTTMKSQLDTLKHNFNEMVSKIMRNSFGTRTPWIDNYIVYGFVKSGSNLHIQSEFVYDSDDVINYLNNLELFDGDATQPLLTARWRFRFFFLLTVNPLTNSKLLSISDAKLLVEGPSYRLYTRSSKLGDTVTISSTPGSIYNYRMFIQSKNTILFNYNDDMVIDVGNGMAVIVTDDLIKYPQE